MAISNAKTWALTNNSRGHSQNLHLSLLLFSWGFLHNACIFFILSDLFMVCLTVVDATTNTPITNVDFNAMENGSPSSSDPDEEMCYSVRDGTDFEVTAKKGGYNDGVRNGLIEQDVNWVIVMNPIVSS